MTAYLNIRTHNIEFQIKRLIAQKIIQAQRSSNAYTKAGKQKGPEE